MLADRREITRQRLGVEELNDVVVGARASSIYWSMGLFEEGFPSRHRN
jgi:hypothetical protein